MGSQSTKLMQHLHRLVGPRNSEVTGDAELLSRFVCRRDEAALAALVSRHGPMVLRVCQRVLGDAHDAEDVFQATFLVLARRGGAIRRRDSLAAWLHGVAQRLASKALAAKLRRQQHEVACLLPAAADHGGDPLAQLTARELVSIVDVELQRLPEAYRLPVILCCLEGRTLDEAAQQLGWTPGSVKGRLERGRARLHDRLVRRGLTLSAALAAVALTGPAVSAAVAQLVGPTIRGAAAFAARQTATAHGISREAAALAGSLVRAMALARLKAAAALMLALGLLAIGFAMSRAIPSQPTASPPEPPSPSSSESGVARAGLTTPVHDRVRVPGDESDGRIEVSGRVFGPAGQPFAGARLYLGYSVHHYAPDMFPGDSFLRPTASRPQATSDREGRFHFTFTTWELDPSALDEWFPAVLAVADGYGPDWAEVGEGEQGRQLSLRLIGDLPLKGRILDAKNQPVVGAKVFVARVISDPKEGATRLLHADIGGWYPRSWRGPFPELPAVMTDAEGRFCLTGLGRDRIINLAFEGPTIPHTLLTAITRPANNLPAWPWLKGATFDHVASPCRSIRGLVRDQATGTPVAGVQMSVLQAPSPAITGQDGRYEIGGCPRGRCIIRARPQPGQPYFAASACVREKADADLLNVDFELVRGIPLSGRVLDSATRKPPRRAAVEYHPLFPNPYSSRISDGSFASIRPDGSYRLVVLPGPGVVAVAASPRNSYAVATFDGQEPGHPFGDGNEDGERQSPRTAWIAGQGRLSADKYNLLAPVNPPKDAPFLRLDFALQPSRTVHGTVVGSDGQLLTGVQVLGLTATPDGEMEMLDGASFAVTGLNPQRRRALTFHHREKGLGKALTLRGDETGPLTVSLDPCGSVVGRIVDRHGQPVPDLGVSFKPGDDTVQTDRDGRFRMALVPERKYTLFSMSRPLYPVQFDVASGRNRDLGDLALAD